MEPSHRYMIINTIFMVFGPAAMGIYLEIVGPTLPDLKYKLDASYEKISRVLVARSVGYFLSSICGGILVDYIAQHTDLIMSVAFLIGGIGTAAIPWCEQLLLMAIMFHLQGVGEGLIDTCNNSLCARMWKDKAATPLHALHFGFGIGAVLAPQLARPFISDFQDISGNMTTSNGSGPGFTNKTSVEYSEQIYIPYTISGILVFCFTIIFLCYYIYEKMSGITFLTDKNENHDLENMESSKLRDGTEDKKWAPDHENKTNFWAQTQEVFSPGTCAGGDVFFGLKMFILIFIFYANIVGGERAYGKFIFSYATNCNADITKDEATFINSLFWIFFTSGRGIAMILSKFIKSTILLPTELALNVMICVVLCIWGYDVKLILYIFSALIGLVLSPVFPAGMSWANNYIQWKGVAVSIVFTGGATGGIIYQWCTGLFFDVYGPLSLMFVMLGYALLLSGTFVFMVVITFRRPYRFKNRVQGNK